MKYAIVGFGCAGYYAAKTIRESDPEGEITVYSEHGYAPYNPMLTTYYVAGKIPFEGLFPFGSLEDVTRELKLEMLSGRRVSRVDAEGCTVFLEDGTARSFDRVLIATGASAFAPNVEGLAKEDTFFMRTLDDAVRLRVELEKKPHRSALVVGASMVGIKVVELLNNRGIETTLADMAPRVFPLAAYENVSREIERRIGEKGVKLALGKAMSGAEKTEGGYMCKMSDGSEVFADLIVLCIGTRANVAVADREQISIGRGISVDESMQTSARGIYAAGDCCEGRELQSEGRMIIGLWANAAHQGTAAGANMAGSKAGFDGNFLHNITHFMDMDFIGFGDNRLTGQVFTSGDIRSGLYVEAVVNEKGLVGVNILDNYRISGSIKNYLYMMMENKSAEISPVQKGILIKEGLKPSFIERLESRLGAI